MTGFFDELLSSFGAGCYTKAFCCTSNTRLGQGRHGHITDTFDCLTGELAGQDILSTAGNEAGSCAECQRLKRGLAATGLLEHIGSHDAALPNTSRCQGGGTAERGTRHGGTTAHEKATNTTASNHAGRGFSDHAGEGAGVVPIALGYITETLGFIVHDGGRCRILTPLFRG